MLMDTPRCTNLERSTLTFSVEGLQTREELLFKSFVRLLDHLTDQQWTYHPPAQNAHVDLLVVADGFLPTVCRHSGLSSQPLLKIATQGSNESGMLPWPIKPASLEQALNRLGSQALKQRVARNAKRQLTDAASGIPMTLDANSFLIRLHHWPPAGLLAGPGRIRLATLLTAKAMSLNELASRSALPIQLCKAFIEDLQRASLLLSHGVTPQPARQLLKPPPKATQPGLLDKIRMRLGIKNISH